MNHMEIEKKAWELSALDHSKTRKQRYDELVDFVREVSEKTPTHGQTNGIAPETNGITCESPLVDGETEGSSEVRAGSSRNCTTCAKSMAAYADSMCDPLKERIAELESEPPYDGLLRCLEKDWHISASWDGLRKFWNVELTEEGVRLRDAESDACDQMFQTHMLLPVDADGVPIRVGDLLYTEDGEMHYCHGIGKPSLDIMDEHMVWWRSDSLHHPVTKRTVEDVLADVRDEPNGISSETNGITCESPLAEPSEGDAVAILREASGSDVSNLLLINTTKSYDVEEAYTKLADMVERDYVRRDEYEAIADELNACMEKVHDMISKIREEEA